VSVGTLRDHVIQRGGDAPVMRLRARQSKRHGTTSASIAIALGALLVFSLLTACSDSNGAAKSADATPTTAARRNVSSKPKRAHRQPPVPDVNVYAATRSMSPVAGRARSLIYVPESFSSYVDVIDPTTYKVIDRYYTGTRPQHVVPSWDLHTLYATNNLGNSLTPIDPNTGKIAGPNIPVEDPYNLYFTPSGTSAIVVAERMQRLDFRDPHTFALQVSLHLDCAGVDHIDFSRDGRYLIATCEFAGRLVKIDVAHRKVLAYLDLPGSSPQDIKLEPAGHIFWVADMKRGGVYEIDGASMSVVGFIPTGYDAHGLYPSRDSKLLYVSNRRSGSISVIDFATRRLVVTWHLPGTTPDMGGVSVDGKVLWFGGRFSDAVYAISTTDGHLIASIPVPNRPHGLCVWPQPGRYSIGHTGIMR
jgi:DNA-binding beta-propeller fold protein YncE